MKKLMEKETREKFLYAAAFIFSALLLFYKIYPVIMAVHDDMRIYTLVRGGELWKNAIHSAKQGRISHLWNHLLLGFPFILNKIWFYKLVSFSTYLFDIWAMWLFVRSHIDKGFANLCAVAAVAFSSLTPSHNLLVSYAFCHQLPIGLLFLSLHFFMKSFDTGKKRDTLLSCLFLLLSCMIYEAFVAALILYGAAAMLKLKTDDKNYLSYIFTAVAKIVPQIITAAAYVGVYFTWRHFYPPYYGGTELYLKTPFTSLKALVTYSLSYFPVNGLLYRNDENPISMSDFIECLSAASVIKALLVAAAFALLVRKISQKLDFKGNLFIAFLGIFVPNIVISVSKQYLDWSIKGTKSYLSSFYSYLFLIIFLCGISCAAYRLFKGRNVRITFLAVMSAAVFFVCLSADALTNIWRVHYDRLSIRYRNFDEAVSSDEIVSCDGGWQIYAPDNQGIHLLETYTLDYIRIYDDTPASVYVSEAAELEKEKKTVCMRSPENYQLMVIGNVDEALCAESVTVESILPNTFDVVLCTADGEKRVFEDVKDDDVLSCPDGSMIDMSVRVMSSVSD